MPCPESRTRGGAALISVLDGTRRRRLGGAPVPNALLKSGPRGSLARAERAHCARTRPNVYHSASVCTRLRNQAPTPLKRPLVNTLPRSRFDRPPAAELRSHGPTARSGDPNRDRSAQYTYRRPPVLCQLFEENPTPNHSRYRRDRRLGATGVVARWADKTQRAICDPSWYSGVMTGYECDARRVRRIR